MFQIYDSNTNYTINNFVSSSFVETLKKKWDDLHQETGIFRYQINITEKIIDDTYLVQLNTNRGTKRRAPENISHISQPFNKEKFNFTKVSGKEIMFTLTKNNDESNKHAILVNVSPINQYHSLLCPSMYKELPQVVTLESLRLAFELMLYIEDRSLNIGFNSLCAQASVNHLHYHLLFEQRRLPVQFAKCKQLKGSLCILEDYALPTFCFDVDKSNIKAVQDIFKLLQCMLKKCIAHNIFITWVKGTNNPEQDTIRVLIWPRKSCAGVKNLAAFTVATCELAGWFPVYNAEGFESMQREDLEDELKKWTYEEFNELCDEIKLLF